MDGIISRQSTYRSLEDAQNCAEQENGKYRRTPVDTGELDIYDLEKATDGCVKADWRKWWSRTIQAGVRNAMKMVREQEWRERHDINCTEDE